MIGIKSSNSNNQVGIKQPFSKLGVGIKAPQMMNNILNHSGKNYNPEKGIVNTYNNVDVINEPITSKPPQTKSNNFKVEKQRKEKYNEPYI